MNPQLEFKPKSKGEKTVKIFLKSELDLYRIRVRKWSPRGKARGSQETPTRGEHPVPEDQFVHGENPWSSWFGIDDEQLTKPVTSFE